MSSELLEKILDIGRQLAERRTLEPLLRYAMETALDLCDAEYGDLVLLEADGTFDFRLAQNHRGEPLHVDDDQISHSIIEQVVVSREPLITAEASADPLLQDAKSVKTLQLRSVMCVPLIAHEKVLGARYVENRSEANVFQITDLKPLQYFAAQAAVAIENATLNDELESLVAERTAELEHAMGELERRWLEAIEFNRLRSELISRITHDIRSPLTVVVGTLSLIEEALASDLPPRYSRADQRLPHDCHAYLAPIRRFF